jgi:hypothetical protein
MHIYKIATINKQFLYSSAVTFRKNSDEGWGLSEVLFFHSWSTRICIHNVLINMLSTESSSKTEEIVTMLISILRFLEIIHILFVFFMFF